MLVRDSAGVTIVASFEPAWAEGEGWTLSDEPVVTIGMEDGPEEYSLYQVMGALMLPDGSFVIANSGSDELRYFDSTGTFLYSVGNDGFGPGEFKMMRGVWLVADSLVVQDDGQDRVSVFSAAGEYGRTMMLYRDRGIYGSDAVGVFADGSILGRHMVFDRHAQADSGFQFLRTDVVYRRFSRDGAELDSLGVFPWLEVVLETVETEIDEVNDMALSRAVAGISPFSRAASTIALGDCLYHGSSDSYEIQVYSKEGTLKRIMRRPIPNPPVTARDRELFRDYWLEDNGEWGRLRANELEYPETKPAYGAVKVDALGNVWVAEYTMRQEDRGRNWTVFDPDGKMLGNVGVPRGGWIFDIGADHLIGVWRTDLDVEQVKMYRLFRDDAESGS